MEELENMTKAQLKEKIEQINKKNINREKDCSYLKETINRLNESIKTYEKENEELKSKQQDYERIFEQTLKSKEEAMNLADEQEKKRIELEEGIIKFIRILGK
ncbi:MAG: hypothetical protein IJ086_06860 [Clostridium sp.]|nr:hypothetical protein [Clostridium sp.]MBQ9298772.1 hypothetical protein [Clostridia bacterium]